MYNLPNRDCDAANSDGEFCCDGSAPPCDYLKPGDCHAGLAQYETKFIDPIAALFQKYGGSGQDDLDFGSSLAQWNGDAYISAGNGKNMLDAGDDVARTGKLVYEGGVGADELSFGTGLAQPRTARKGWSA